MTRRSALRRCVTCRTKPVAWSQPRVDYCYDCLPGGPFAPPACRRCGSAREYFTGGLCRRCHQRAPQPVESCQDCLAWGVIRKTKWLCWGCKNWRSRQPIGTCLTCRAERPVNPDGVCRLCWRQFSLCGGVKGGADVVEANRFGQQLFFANIHFAIATRGRRPLVRQAPQRIPPLRLVEHRQLAFFDLERDLVAGRLAGFGPPRDALLAEHLDRAIIEHATKHGWGRTTEKVARQAMTIVLSLQDTPGALVRASDLAALVQIDMPVRRLIEVCTAEGVLDDDRRPSIETWFAKQTADLPEPMRHELDAWFDVMLHGRTEPPRSRPRSPTSIRSYLAWALPVLTSWAQTNPSLREISKSDVLAVLPPSGNPRSTMGQGLRSIFTVLKSLKLVFVNPTRGLDIGAHARTQPLPISIDLIRDALDSTDPARAAVAALLAFHGLLPGQLRTLALVDVADGHLHVAGRRVPLADPVRARLTDWLAHRAARWPNTINPHLFINKRSAIRTDPVGVQWLHLTLGLTPRALREDRILDEVHATNGDIRRICDLFGLTVSGAERYVAVLNHPALDGPPVDATIETTGR